MLANIDEGCHRLPNSAPATCGTTWDGNPCASKSMEHDGDGPWLCLVSAMRRREKTSKLNKMELSVRCFMTK